MLLQKKKNRRKKTLKMLMFLFSLMLLYCPKLKNEFGLFYLLVSPTQIRKTLNFSANKIVYFLYAVDI